MRRALHRIVVLAALVAALLLVPGVARAHPLGNFTVNLFSELRLLRGEVRVDYVLDMAEIPTFQEMPNIDTDGDGRADRAERDAWAAAEAAELVSGLALAVDGEPIALEARSASMSFRPGQGGLPILRMEATFVGPLPAAGRLEYHDGNYPGRVGWREITAVGDGVAIEGSTVPAGSVSGRLRSYPGDLLSSPLDVRGARLSFEEGAGAPAAAAEVVGGGGRPGVSGGGFADLVARSRALTVLPLLLALGFGALHALGPGHGKTLIAAFLVGGGGRFGQAVAVGAAVALMHTASVLGLGVLVLSSEGVLPPERAYPWLGLLSGLVAVALGAGLLVRRIRAGGGAWEDHGHPHDHRLPDRARLLSRSTLVALAFAGGVVPSPTALVVLLASIALDRVAFGLALIGAFSLGLAGSLVVVGLLALRARDVLSRRLSTKVGRLLPVLSASAIAVVGLVLAAAGAARL